MQDHFEIMEQAFKKELKVEQFNEYYSPEQTLQRVCGRVLNLSTEDSKMKEQTIGLFNAAYDLQCRLRLNL